MKRNHLKRKIIFQPWSFRGSGSFLVFRGNKSFCLINHLYPSKIEWNRIPTDPLGSCDRAIGYWGFSGVRGLWVRSLEISWTASTTSTVFHSMSWTTESRLPQTRCALPGSYMAVKHKKFGCGWSSAVVHLRMFHPKSTRKIVVSCVKFVLKLMFISSDSMFRRIFYSHKSTFEKWEFLMTYLTFEDDIPFPKVVYILSSLVGRYYCFRGKLF